MKALKTGKGLRLFPDEVKVFAKDVKTYTDATEAYEALKSHKYDGDLKADVERLTGGKIKEARPSKKDDAE